MKKQKLEENKVNNNLAIEVINFSKKYRGRSNYAVHNANFSVKLGEFHGFIGANGAGKTTTIKSLIGAYGTLEGEIKIFGYNNHTSEAKKHLGYIPEAANFPKTLNTIQYISHMANLSGMPMKEAKKFAKETLQEIGLGPVMKKKPYTFSSGQKKKVLLAQALVGNPDVIVMDEPAANLDPQARSDFFIELQKLQNQGKAIFISSHILSELEQYTTAVTILDGGKVVYSGDVKTLLENKDFEYRFLFKTKTDEKTFVDWVTKNKWSNRKGTEGYLVVGIQEEKNLEKIIDFVAKSKLSMIHMTSNKKTLQQAYDKFVKLGSVDTKGEDVKARKEVKNA